jgi:hypothetical protein
MSADVVNLSEYRRALRAAVSEPAEDCAGRESVMCRMAATLIEHNIGLAPNAAPRADGLQVMLTLTRAGFSVSEIEAYFEPAVRAARTFAGEFLRPGGSTEPNDVGSSA